MMNRRAFLIWSAGAAGLMALGGGVLAATRAELQERFKQRLPRLAQLKRDGKLGETWEGYVEIVRAEDRGVQELATFVREENADRRELYRIIAEEQNTEPQLVGQRNAVRTFEKARRGEYLKTRDGKWTQKE